jgi:hypothetical protein
MGFSVEWSDGAAADFMELWASSPDKAALTAAARAVDRLLEQEPLHERHEVVQGFGIVVCPPLGVDFWIDQANQKVFVTAAWLAGEGQ